MSIEWRKEYELGINIIDYQHQRLITIANEIDAITQRRETGNDQLSPETEKLIETSFLNLINYYNYHFTIEEMAMEKCNYPEFSDHQMAHDKFVEKIHECYKKYHKQHFRALHETVEFLNAWLIDHIMVEDRKYVTELSVVFSSKSK